MIFLHSCHLLVAKGGQGEEMLHLEYRFLSTSRKRIARTGRMSDFSVRVKGAGIHAWMAG